AVRLGHAERRGRGDGGVRRVATMAQDLECGVGRVGVDGGDRSPVAGGGGDLGRRLGRMLWPAMVGRPRAGAAGTEKKAAQGERRGGGEGGAADESGRVHGLPPEKWSLYRPAPEGPVSIPPAADISWRQWRPCARSRLGAPRAPA